MRRFVFTWGRLAALITLADLIGFVGFWLYRGTLRRTVGVAVALFAVVLIGNKTDATRLDLGQAATGTAVIFIVSCLGGVMLMLLAGSFSKSALTLSEAKGFNLLEEMKKHRKELHRDKLWQRVFRYEQARYPADERRQELATVNGHHAALLDMCDPHRRRQMSPAHRLQYERIIRALGTTEQGWRIAFEYGMQVPMGRAELIYRLRYNLSQLKDWYDGAPFHASDTKLAEQYDANEDLAEIRRDIGYRLRDRWIHSRRRFVQNLWFRTISRAVQVRTAQACARLDRRYVPHRFSIDHLLWPSQLVDLRVRETLGEPALDELRAVRRRLFHRVFHSDVDLAHKLMHKAIYPNFFAATVLRRRYDPEYLLGELTDAWSVDIRRHNRAFRQTPRMRRRRIRIRRQARARHHRLRLFLAEHPDLRPANCESLRALRIAYHTNHQNLRARIDRGVDRADRSSLHALDRHPQSIDSMVRDIAQNPTPFTRKLLSIRLHHELARLELEDYEFYLERILK